MKMKKSKVNEPLPTICREAFFPKTKIKLDNLLWIDDFCSLYYSLNIDKANRNPISILQAATSEIYKGKYI